MSQTKQGRCSFQYSKRGIRQSTQTAKLLKEIASYKQNLDRKEADFFDEMIGRFSWTSEQSGLILELHQKVYDTRPFVLSP